MGNLISVMTQTTREKRALTSLTTILFCNTPSMKPTKSVHTHLLLFWLLSHVRGSPPELPLSLAQSDTRVLYASQACCLGVWRWQQFKLSVVAECNYFRWNHDSRLGPNFYFRVSEHSWLMELLFQETEFNGIHQREENNNFQVVEGRRLHSRSLAANLFLKTKH